MIKTNAIGEQCIRNGDGVPTLGDEDRKKYLGKNIMRSVWTEFAWERNSLSQTDIVSGVTCLID